MSQRIRKKDRHIRWNWEQSEAFYDDAHQVRYHVVVVDNRFREQKLDQVYEQLERVGAHYDEVRREEGKVIDSPHRYLFVSFDTPLAPRMVDWHSLSLPVTKDSDLRERKSGSEGISLYVQRTYSE